MSSTTSVFDDLVSSPQTLPTSQFKFLLNLHLSDTTPTFSTIAHSRNDVPCFNDCTEILGSESGDHFKAEEDPHSVAPPLHSSNAAGISRSTTSYSPSTTRTAVGSDGQDFSPKFLSTLNRHGRPRFLLKKLRISDGDGFRLLITIVKDERFFSSDDVSVIEKTGSLSCLLD